MTGGLLVMALTAVAIMSNALLLQGGRDVGPPAATDVRRSPVIENPPLPRLAPRSTAANREQVPSAVPTVEQEVVSVQPVPPMPVLQPAPVVPPQDPSPEMQLVGDIQRELARIGLYNDAIDGVTGPRTAAAIRAFEQAAGVPVTGVARPELLAVLKQPIRPRQAEPIVTASVRQDTVAQELDQRERERARLIEAEQQQQAANKSQETYKVVQAALNRIGYGPVPIDGSAGPETLDAIRRFELDNGMSVTGHANDALIARLVAIGAIRPG
jgi:peptidoglycan hydrolase-like protein with peptidoglycan-binding domain